MVDVDVNTQCGATLVCPRLTFYCVREKGHKGEHHAHNATPNDINDVTDHNTSEVLRRWIWIRE